MAEWEPILREQLAEVLAQVCAEGFEPPLYCTFLDGNGSNVYGRYEEIDGGLSFTIITAHMQAEDFTLPMHALLVDQMGEAAHVTLDVHIHPSVPPTAVWN
jgi:hypothetical protein